MVTSAVGYPRSQLGEKFRTQIVVRFSAGQDRAQQKRIAQDAATDRNAIAAAFPALNFRIRRSIDIAVGKECRFREQFPHGLKPAQSLGAGNFRIHFRSSAEMMDHPVRTTFTDCGQDLR